MPNTNIDILIHAVASSGVMAQVKKEMEVPDPVDYPNYSASRLPFWFEPSDE